MNPFLRAAPAAVFALACLSGSGAFAADSTEIAKGLQALNPNDVKQVIATLSSDDFEGREPGSHGETLTVDYIADQFKKIGLVPGNPNGSYVQDAGLTGHHSHPEAKIGDQALAMPDDFVAWSY